MMAVLDRHEQMFEENRIFIRDMNRRNEKVVQDLVRHSGEASAQHARDTAAIVARLEDLTEESKAQREGLLAATRSPYPDGRSSLSSYSIDSSRSAPVLS
jgi:hypothetical protein